jgi:hypothetical protein
VPAADIIVGREVERLALEGLLGLIPGGADAGIVRGPGGMGKPTLVEHVSRSASSRGLRLLRASPSATESRCHTQPWPTSSVEISNA